MPLWVLLYWWEKPSYPTCMHALMGRWADGQRTDVAGCAGAGAGAARVIYLVAGAGCAMRARREHAESTQRTRREQECWPCLYNDDSWGVLVCMREDYVWSLELESRA